MLFKKTISAVVAVVLFLISLPAISAENYVDGELIIKYKSERSAMRSIYSDNYIKSNSSTPAELITENTYLIKTDDNISSLINKLMSDNSSDIEYAEPNYKVHTLVYPNDTYFQDNRTKKIYYQFTAENGASLHNAWTLTNTDASNIIVGVVDTGVMLYHEDLATNIENNGINTIDTISAVNYGTGKGNDDNGHGTHVAGIIGAVGDNGVGTAGVVWKTKILPIKVLNAKGTGTTTTIIKGIDYAIKYNKDHPNGPKIVVLNASYGGTAKAFSSVEYLSIKAALDSGIVVVAAAGNDEKNTDYDPEYPAAFGLRGLISVGASDQNSRRAIFNSPVEPGSCYGRTTVHLFAPGENITSTYYSSSKNNSYAAASGTSMAAPFVTGAVAMLLSKKPNLTPAEVEMILLNSVRRASGVKNDSMSSGILDVYSMMRFDTSLLFDAPYNLDFKVTDSPNTVSVTWQGGSGDTEIYVKFGERSEYRLLATVKAGAHEYIDTMNGTYKGKQAYRIRSIKNGVYSPFVRKDILQTEYIDIDTKGSVATGGCSVGSRKDFGYLFILMLVVTKLSLNCVRNRRNLRV